MKSKVIKVIPEYWQQAKEELMRRDRILRKIIPQCNDEFLVGRGQPFMTLARSIIGQQISVKAAEAVWQKFLKVCPDCTALQVFKAGHEGLQACGLSKRKMEYIVDLATQFKEKKVHVNTWPTMTDEEIIADLVQIRGIGRWTAEMFLIFNLCRPDVLPLDDIGLLKSVSINYFSGEPVSRSDVREVAANWEPWRTVATWYLWRSLDPIPVEY